MVVKHIRDFERMLTDNALSLRSLERTGKGHYKMTVADAKGRTMVYVLGSSTSDHRAAANRKRDILRFFNN